jgi:hypothetical protein
MNLGNMTQRVLGHRAIPISELLRQELVASIGLNDPVDYCATAYSVGKYSGQGNIVDLRLAHRLRGPLV